MATEKVISANRTAELREEFDASFARAPHTEPVTFENVLAIRVGSDPYALRLGDVSGLFSDRVIVRVPTLAPSLLGVASLRGEIISVHDLRVLLGYPDDALPRWLVITAVDSTVGLAFDQFEGHAHLPREAIAVERHAEPSAAPTREVARVGDVIRPILPIPSIVDAIRNGSRVLAAPKEP